MKLIVEHTENLLVESKVGPNKDYFIKGIFLQGNIENRNGRVYPMHILEKEVSRYNQVYTSQRRAFGQMDHPDGPGINLDRVSHLTESLVRDGNNYIGSAKILNTPMGNIAKAFIDEGAKLGVSSRGMGTLKENARGIMEVQSDFTLTTCADIVSDPSGPDAFVNGIMEGREYDFVNGVLTERFVEKVKKHIPTVPQKRLDEEILKAFTEYLKIL